MASRIVPDTITGPPSQSEWVFTRYNALRGVLDAQNVPNASAVAVGVVAHWARETGWGESEHEYNIGNIKDSPAWRGAAQVLPDGLAYRAYPDLASGVADTVALLQAPRYADSWAYLTQTGDGHGWYDRLMHAGWHPWSQHGLDEYDSIRARVSRILQLAPPVPPPSSARTTLAVVGGVALGGAILAWWASRRSPRAPGR